MEEVTTEWWDEYEITINRADNVMVWKSARASTGGLMDEVTNPTIYEMHKDELYSLFQKLLNEGVLVKRHVTGTVFMVSLKDAGEHND